MSDIVERLYNRAVYVGGVGIAHDAAQEIESLRQQLAAANAELERMNTSPTIEACRQMIRDKAVIEASVLHDQLAEAKVEIARRVTLDEMTAEIEIATKAVDDFYEKQLAEKDAGIELERTARQQLEKLLHRQAETISASQAREQQLRDAVTELLCYNEKSIWVGGVENGCLQAVGSSKLNAILKCESALDSPQDTSALEALIAKAGEVMRERCAKEADAMRAMYRSQASGHYDATYDFKQMASEEIIEEICALPGVKLEDLK